MKVVKYPFNALADLTFILTVVGMEDKIRSHVHPVTSILKANFNGRNAFSASMTNSFANADPCVGTYKYSIIKYACA